MTRKQLDEYANTRNVLAQYGVTAAELDALHRAETALSRINKRQCSEEMGIRETERVENRTQCIEERIRAMMETHGIKVRINGDPRGGAVRLVLPNGASNNWDGQTWGIYW